jgi:hypothetical protein
MTDPNNPSTSSRSSAVARCPWVPSEPAARAGPRIATRAAHAQRVTEAGLAAAATLNGQLISKSSLRRTAA